MKNTNEKNKPRSLGSVFVSILLALTLVACNGGDTQENPPSSTDTSKPADPIETFFSESAIPEARALGEVLKTAQPGETVRVTGQIGGTVKPFGEDFAIFMLADESLTFCNEMAVPDHCPTPWDACCEPPEKLRKNRTVVQLSNAAGEVIPVDLKGRQGLQELKRITLEGTLVQREDDGSFFIEGKRIYAPQTAELQ